MKIYLLDTSPIRRGAQVFLDDLANGLEEEGFSTRKAYLYKASSSVTLTIRKQDVVLGFSASSLLEKFPTFNPRLLYRVAKDIEDFSPDVILFNGSRTLKYAAWLRVLGLVAKVKFVGRFIDDAIFWNQNPLKRRIYQFWLNQLDAIVGVSLASLNSLINHYDFQKKSVVIHRAFDFSKFEDAAAKVEARKSLGLAENDDVLLFLGNLTQQKRPDRFIEIVRKLSQSRPNLKALIVGGGDLEVNLKSQFSNLSSQVFFAGYQSDVSPYLVASDLLILTSVTEGLPGVILEAAHFEVPAVASIVGGMEECLIDGETGFLISDFSVSGFCEKIDYILDHPEMKCSMGEKARSFVHENFQMKKVTNQYIDFFNSLG